MNSAQIESLLGPLGKLLEAMLDFMWWSIWLKGFGCGLAIIMIPLVIVLSAVAYANALERKRDAG